MRWYHWVGVGFGVLLAGRWLAARSSGVQSFLRSGGVILVPFEEEGQERTEQGSA